MSLKGDGLKSLFGSTLGSAGAANRSWPVSSSNCAGRCGEHCRFNNAEKTAGTVATTPNSTKEITPEGAGCVPRIKAEHGRAVQRVTKVGIRFLTLRKSALATRRCWAVRFFLAPTPEWRDATRPHRRHPPDCRGIAAKDEAMNDQCGIRRTAIKIPMAAISIAPTWMVMRYSSTRSSRGSASSVTRVWRWLSIAQVCPTETILRTALAVSCRQTSLGRPSAAPAERHRLCDATDRRHKRAHPRRHARPRAAGSLPACPAPRGSR